MFISWPKILQRWIGVLISEELGYKVATPLQRKFHCRSGQIAVVFKTCSKNLQDRLLASNFAVESADATYTFIMLIKTLLAI